MTNSQLTTALAFDSLTTGQHKAAAYLKKTQKHINYLKQKHYVVNVALYYELVTHIIRE
jgi:hypothetical protein